MFHVQAPFSSLTLLNVYTTAVYLKILVSYLAVSIIIPVENANKIISASCFTSKRHFPH